MFIYILILVTIGVGLGLLNIAIYKYLINRAVKKRIKPRFEATGYFVDRIERVGSPKTGDFKKKREFIPFFFKNGSPYKEIYIYVTLTKNDDSTNYFRTTAKIKCVLFFVIGVEYASLPFE